MKKLFLTFSLAAAMLTSCTKDETNNTNGSVVDGNKISFTLLGINSGAVTYALTGTAAENHLDITTLKVYMFNATTNLVEAIYDYSATAAAGKFTTTVAATETTATLTIDRTLTGSKYFYFLGNATAANVDPAMIADIAVGTTKAAFIAKTTVAATGIKPTPLADNSTPLLMTGLSPTFDIGSVPSVPVKMLRRVARLDIKHDVTVVAPELSVDIKEIRITNIATKGFIFAGNGTDYTLLEKFDPAIITKTDVPALNDGTLHTLGYINPTSLGTSEIAIVASIAGGANQIFIVKPPIGNSLGINANTRYLITVNPTTVNENMFVLEVADWSEQAIIGSPEATVRSTMPANAPLRLYDLTAVAAGHVETLTFDVYADKSVALGDAVLEFVEFSGIDAGSTADFSIAKVSTTAPTISTYGTGYKSTYTVTITKKRDLDREVLARVIIKNGDKKHIAFSVVYHHASGDVSNDFYIGTNLKPIVVGGVTWAPVNVGAATTDVSVLNESSVGRVFQWGRNNVSWGCESTVIGRHNGVVSLEDATTGVYKNAFILSNSGNFNWHSPSDLTLWADTNSQGPCPTAWRLPKSAELGKLVTAYSNGPKLGVVNGILTIPCDTEVEVMLLPAAGSVGRTVGNSPTPGTYGSYWSSGMYTDASTVVSGPRLHFWNGQNPIVQNANPSDAFSVRCVKQ